MKQNAKLESQIHGIWHITEVVWEGSVEKKEFSLTGSRKRVIHKKRTLYTHLNNQQQMN